MEHYIRKRRELLISISVLLKKTCQHSWIELITFFLLQILYHEDGSVKGIATNDVGIKKDGAPKVSGQETNMKEYELSKSRELAQCDITE